MSQREETLAGIAKAIEESGFQTGEQAEASEWNSFEDEAETEDETDETPTAETPAESEPSTAEPQAEEPTPETDDGTGEEAPTSYWGVDLTGIPPEKRAEVIAHFEQQDSRIQKLQERLTKEPETPETPPTPDEPEEITDEDLLRAVGYDPELVSAEDAAPILKLARSQLDLEAKVEALTTQSTTNAVEQQWNSALDDLEATYGKLPFERIQVLRFALEEGLTSPFETYYRITAPIQKEVGDAAQAARREALKNESVGGLKPRSSTAGDKVITKGMSVREAVAVAAKNAEKTTKLSWREALSKRKGSSEE